MRSNKVNYDARTGDKVKLPNGAVLTVRNSYPSGVDLSDGCCKSYYGYEYLAYLKATYAESHPQADRK